MEFVISNRTCKICGRSFVLGILCNSEAEKSAFELLALGVCRCNECCADEISELMIKLCEEILEM